uniref:Rho GDP-dissociation inhibitor 1 n=1 Tax=Schistocephalus solidus TaxID=70667 RepID=A0A0X3NZF9_SCHSO
MAAPTGDDADLVPEPDLYKAPEKKTIEELVKLDADDEALKRYKENLLGSVAQCTPFPNDQRHLIVQKLEVIIKDGPTFSLDLEGDLEKLRDEPIEIPEGSFYNVRVTFYVQREIIAGLRYLQSAHKGIAKMKDDVMLGSYAPRMEPIVWVSGEEEAPSGNLSRGVYAMTSKFMDDDKNEHVKFKWAIKIVKKALKAPSL